MSSSKFRHIGEVVAIDDKSITITMKSHPSCEGCKARGKCGVVDGSEEGTKIVVASNDAIYNIGERVEVSIAYRMGMYAVLMTYFLPLVVFVSVILTLLGCGVTEGVAAMATFGVLTIYYMILYLLRDSLGRVVTFEIRQKN